MKLQSIRAKMSILAAFSLISLSIIILVFTQIKFSNSLTNSRLDQLSSVVSAKKDEIEKYFGSIRSLIVSTAKNTTTIRAMMLLSNAFHNLPSDLSIDIDQAKKL